MMRNAKGDLKQVEQIGCLAEFSDFATEALPYWIERAERLERALERACGYIAEHDFDLPCPDYIDGWDGCEKKEEGCTYDIARPAECWKRYFMETDR